jgi:hypothetical protein
MISLAVGLVCPFSLFLGLSSISNSIGFNFLSSPAGPLPQGVGAAVSGGCSLLYSRLETMEMPPPEPGVKGGAQSPGKMMLPVMSVVIRCH